MLSGRPLNCLDIRHYGKINYLVFITLLWFICKNSDRQFEITLVLAANFSILQLVETRHSKDIHAQHLKRITF